MFYYLLYNSSFSFIVESRLFSTILYGSILYILTHAVLNYCDISILNIINNYYWTLFTLDIISFFYSLYQSFNNNNNANDNANDNINDSQNNLNVSFNLLKNKINTFIDRKNDLTVTQIPVQQQNNNNNINTNNLQNTNVINKKQNNTMQNNTMQNNTMQNNTNKFSTPISQLQNIKQNTNGNINKSSTPISLIRNNINIEDPYIDEQTDIHNQCSQGNQGNQGNQNNQYSESIAGSDVGSIMDLAEFETTL